MKFTKGKVAVAVIAVIVVVTLFSLEKIGGSESGEFKFTSAKPLVKEDKVFLKINLEGGELFLGPPEIHLYGPDGSELYDGKASEGESYKLILITSKNQTPDPGRYRVELVSEKLLMEERYFEFKGSRLEVKDVDVKTSHLGAQNYSLDKIQISVENNGDLPAFVEPEFELDNRTIRHSSKGGFIEVNGSRTFHFEVSKFVESIDYNVNILLKVDGEVFKESKLVSVS